MDAGFSAFWLQGQTQNISIRGNRIERPGFCGFYLQGLGPGDTTADGVGVLPNGPVQSKIRVPLFAARTLNATGQYRVTLSL